VSHVKFRNTYIRSCHMARRLLISHNFFRMAQADDKCMVNSDGRPNTCRPNIWKGENGLYFSGFRRMGLAGICMDAYNIANEIVSVY
jgi:hypothetical protein